jgi:hypothetical protein
MFMEANPDKFFGEDHRRRDRIVGGMLAGLATDIIALEVSAAESGPNHLDVGRDVLIGMGVVALGGAMGAIVESGFFKSAIHWVQSRFNINKE